MKQRDMYKQMADMVEGWMRVGVDQDLILSRFFGVAVASMRSAGVTFPQMLELVALYYGKVPVRRQVAA